MVGERLATSVGEDSIDVHLHAIPQRYRAALHKIPGLAIRAPEWTPELALAMMDRHGIGGGVLSLSAPGVSFADRAEAAELARALNDDAAEVVARHPRLGSFATLPLPDVEASCTEAARALDVLELDGVGVLTGYGGQYLGNPVYDPLLAVLDERGAVVLIHPAVHPSMSHVALRVPNFMLEYPFDTTRAAVNIIFSDVLDRFPRIRFILSHGGGTLPYLSWRIAGVAMRQLSQPPPHERWLRDIYPTPLTERHELVSTEFMGELMRRFYYDIALTADPAGLGTLLGFADQDRILFGSDWPYAYDVVVDDQVASLDLLAPGAARTRITRTNAAALFPRFDRSRRQMIPEA